MNITNVILFHLMIKVICFSKADIFKAPSQNAQKDVSENDSANLGNEWRRRVEIMLFPGEKNV